jgi:hypothetical protein
METIRAFLNALPSAATSPYAFAAYALALGAWVINAWQGQKPQKESRKILETFKSDGERRKALADLLGVQPPPGLAKAEILEWVRLQSAGRNKTYVLVAYLATLAAILVIVVVALTSNPDGGAHQSSIRIRFVSAGGATDCIPLPATARLAVSLPGGRRGTARVQECTADVTWDPDWKPSWSATLDLSGAPGFVLADARANYPLREQEWAVALAPQNRAPRLTIEVFDYSGVGTSPERQESFQRFCTIVRNKINMLVETLVAGNKACNYLVDLRLARVTRELTGSPSETLAVWQDSYALALFSGLFFNREQSLFVRSQPFLGELSSSLPSSRLQLDLRIDENEFSQTVDSHSLVVLYALAMDARRLGYSRDVVFALLAEAVSIARGLDSSLAGVRPLKDALRESLRNMGAPAPAEL